MTYRVSTCPSCSSQAWKAYPAIIAPFVAEYALSAPPGRTRLIECEDCGLRFFEDRLSDAEIAKLYDGYRGDRYYEVRHRHEPWYTRAMNDGQGDDAARRATIERVVKRQVSHVGELLDFGGDRGQYIPEGLADRSFVHEISGVPSVPGVELLATEKELEGRSFDLVLLCHVLEHASEPRRLVERIAKLLRDRDSLLYVEVPFERPSLRLLGRGKISSGWLGAIRRVRPALLAADLLSTALRHKLDVVPPLGVVKLHEHVNFFDERSLRAALASAGLEVVSVGRELSGSEKTPVVCALARRPLPS
ncbi:MAG: methyltransferase domain-containing protein [Labilithrix sp.]